MTSKIAWEHSVSKNKTSRILRAWAEIEIKAKFQLSSIRRERKFKINVNVVLEFHIYDTLNQR